MELDAESARERLEHRAEVAVSRMPAAAFSIVGALLMNVAAVTWWAAVQSELMQTLSEAVRGANSRIEFVGGKVDQLRDGLPTRRDLEIVMQSVSDHEARLRIVERRNSSPGGITQ